MKLLQITITIVLLSSLGNAQGLSGLSGTVTPSSAPPGQNITLTITAFGAVGICGATVLSGFFLGTGDSRTPLYVTVFVNGLNAALDYALIFGKFGFPALGVSGAAVATTIAEAANVVRTDRLTDRLSGCAINVTPQAPFPEARPSTYVDRAKFRLSNWRRFSICSE